jgi:hypothetical protein
MEKVGELSVAQHTIKTTILIEAQPARVWQVLTDFRAFPTWSPFIRAISGPLQEGVRLSIEITPPGRAAMRFRPTVLVVKPDQELRWRGALLIPGLFSGEHSFQIRPEGRTGPLQPRRDVLGLAGWPLRTPGHARCNPARLSRYEHRPERVRRKSDHLRGGPGGLGRLADLLDCAAVEARAQVARKREHEG